MSTPMKLCLGDGTTLEGRAFGADRETRGEVVFNTGMTGYVETLTDPSYRGQILVFTYPLQGNYGVPTGPFESGRIQVEGVVVTHYSDHPSHHASVEALSAWLKRENVPAIEGVDTRTLTRHLRSHGTMDGFLLRRETDAARAKVSMPSPDMKRVVDAVSQGEITKHPGGDLKLLVVDTGAKENIIRSLHDRGASIVLAPQSARWEPFLDEVDGVMFTNGPGDPADLLPLVERVRTVLARGLPTFGICLGHQLVSMAAGAKTYKLKYGHRSHNQPVQEAMTGRAFVTSQNHGYAVDESTLPSDWATWFTNLNDGTNEGLMHRYKPFRTVQFHPEAAAGPNDTAFLFDDFIAMATAMRKGRRT